MPMHYFVCSLKVALASSCLSPMHKSVSKSAGCFTCQVSATLADSCMIQQWKAAQGFVVQLHTLCGITEVDSMGPIRALTQCVMGLQDHMFEHPAKHWKPHVTVLAIGSIDGPKARAQPKSHSLYLRQMADGRQPSWTQSPATLQQPCLACMDPSAGKHCKLNTPDRLYVSMWCPKGSCDM